MPPGRRPRRRHRAVVGLLGLALLALGALAGSGPRTPLTSTQASFHLHPARRLRLTLLRRGPPGPSTVA